MRDEESSLAHKSDLTLKATNLSWLGSNENADRDQCAHGLVTCTIGRIAVTSRDCNVTAASLFLLRTLEHDHTPSETVAPLNQLFPCCGHSPWVAADERFPTINVGCDSGNDLWVRHVDGAVDLAWGELHERVPSAEWLEAVVSFADLVRAFYDASPPRRRSHASDADAMENDGWDAFWAEWVERYTRARPGSPACPPAFVEEDVVSSGTVRRLWKACLQALRPNTDTPAK